MTSPIEQKIEELTNETLKNIQWSITLTSRQVEVIEKTIREAILYGQQTKAEEVREMIIKEFANFLLCDWSGEHEVLSEIERLKLDILKVLATSSEE